jgi:hypothetical protein
MDLFKPRGAQAPRRPTDNNQNNGQIVNTPRYEQFGGLSGPTKIGAKNKMAVNDRGNGKKVI